eukprot:scaffold38210_cov191-Amphora_coffeaeformis.AAC.9
MSSNLTVSNNSGRELWEWRARWRSTLPAGVTKIEIKAPGQNGWILPSLLSNGSNGSNPCEGSTSTYLVPGTLLKAKDILPVGLST